MWNGAQINFMAPKRFFPYQLTLTPSIASDSTISFTREKLSKCSQYEGIHLECR